MIAFLVQGGCHLLDREMDSIPDAMSPFWEIASVT